MLSNMREKLYEFQQASVDENSARKNVAWIMENRQDLVDSYPNRWVAVDLEVVQCVNIDFQEVMQIMEGRGALTGSMVFYFSNLFRVPMILQLCNATTPEIIS